MRKIMLAQSTKAYPGDDYEIYSWGSGPKKARTSGRFYGKIRDSEQSSGPQANIPLAIILEQILYL